jgi:hypothetical protein
VIWRFFPCCALTSSCSRIRPVERENKEIITHICPWRSNYLFSMHRLLAPCLRLLSHALIGCRHIRNTPTRCSRGRMHGTLPWVTHVICLRHFDLLLVRLYIKRGSKLHWHVEIITA